MSDQTQVTLAEAAQLALTQLEDRMDCRGGLGTEHNCPRCIATKALRAALTQQEGQEVEEQYRVVGNDPLQGGRERVLLSATLDLDFARDHVLAEEDCHDNVRIQRRTRTPWTDLLDHSEDEEGRDG